MQQIGGAIGLATLATLAIRHAIGQMHHGVAAAVARTNGFVLSWRVGAVLCLVGGVLVLFLLEHVIATPRNAEAEVLTGQEVAPVPVA